VNQTTISDIRKLLGGLFLVQSQRGVEALLERLREAQGPFVVSFLNAHAVNIAWNNRGFRQDLLDSDAILRDGKGVEIALSRLGVDPGENLNGTDFIPQLLGAWRGQDVAFLGTREPYLSEAVRRAGKLYGVRVVCKQDGFQTNQEYVELVQKHRPALVILAMGMPKQEAVSSFIRSAIDHPCVIVNGGAILDYMSDRVPRAPLWIRNRGWEWLFRLAVEPVRLFKRYVIGNAVFLWRVRSLRAFGKLEPTLLRRA
jgi:N-acetylglucosaminyldiphosphoundecaprenol N-acetyl-beta-D-mannosaminyltransferase